MSTRARLRSGERFLNRGAEQAALDGLDDAVVNIVTLLTPKPGSLVEPLHDRAPAPPPRAKVVPGDIAATVTVLAPATDCSVASASLTDPDGHRLCLTTS